MLKEQITDIINIIKNEVSYFATAGTVKEYEGELDPDSEGWDPALPACFIMPYIPYQPAVYSPDNEVLNAKAVFDLYVAAEKKDAEPESGNVLDVTAEIIEKLAENAITIEGQTFSIKIEEMQYYGKRKAVIAYKQRVSLIS